jgi:adenylate cyclase
MLKSLIEWSRKVMVTLRFSILFIFVVLFVFSMLTLITISHVRFIDSIERLSFSLMQQASNTAFDQIHNRIQSAEMKSYSIAQLIKLNVIDPHDNAELVSYTVNFMRNEIEFLSGIQAIIWGDATGNTVMAEKMNDGKIYSEVIEDNKKPPTHKTFIQNAMGKMTEISVTHNFIYDPRKRPWYIAAVKARKTTWLGIYFYKLTGSQGTGVSTPVYKNDGALLGVVNLQIRLDNLQRLVEHTQVSKNSLVFIVSNAGKLIAFPKLNLINNETLFDIHKLKSTPWIAHSFDIHNEKHNSIFTFKYKGTKYLASYQPLLYSGESGEKWMIGIVAPADDFITDLIKTQLLTIVINLFILIFGITVVSILITRVVRPLKKITNEIVRIKSFDLSGDLRVSTRIKEIGYIADALVSMKKGLRTFQRYIPATLVRQLIETGEDARIGGVKKPLAILFSDIQNFTSIAEEVDPDELTPHICDYFDALSQIIALNNGTIDKYIGDAIMAFWGAPQHIEDPAIYAARTALRCITRSNELNKQWQAKGKPVLYTRIGIHLGEAIVGNFGSTERINYTAVGDATNIASRLEGINKLYGTQIIVSDSVYNNIKDYFVLRLIDRVAIKGKQEHTEIYELIAETRNEISYDIEIYIAIFAKGFSAYRNKNWDEAIQYFKKCLEIYPKDTVAPVFLNRCLHFKTQPPAAGWDGIWQLNEK